MLIQPEDPHRRRYKLFLAVSFLIATVINFSLDLALQVRIAKTTILNIQFTVSLTLTFVSL